MKLINWLIESFIDGAVILLQGIFYVCEWIPWLFAGVLALIVLCIVIGGIANR